MTQPFGSACVTGGAGFIGTHLTRALLARGVAVTVLDDLSIGRRESIPDEARFIEGDILDMSSVETALEGSDVLFHLAARVAIRSSFEFVVEDTRTNVVGTASVLRAAQQSERLRKIVSASSMAVYADAPLPEPIGEAHPTTPVSPYGVSKLAVESLTHQMAAGAGKQSTVLRLFNTYGPGQALSPYVGVVTIFVDKLRAGEAPSIFGDGEQCRDFVHVEDVVRGFLCAMDAEISGETFNIGTGIATSVNEVLRRVRVALGSSIEGVRQPPVAGELRNSVADVAKAAAMLGYRPQRGFGESIGQVVDELSAAGAS